MFIKRSLTSMQIMQFLVGASYAMSHSFISYAVPVVIRVAKTTTTAAAAAATAVAAEPTPATILDSVRGWLTNAVSLVTSAAAAQDTATPPAPEAIVEEVLYGQQVVPCITTSGETFAIWLNVLYLAPLTYLFAKFFVTSYLRRSSAESARVKSRAVDGERIRRLSGVSLAEKAGWDAAKDLEKEVYGENGSAVVDEDRLSPFAAHGKGMRRVNGKTNVRVSGRGRVPGTFY